MANSKFPLQFRSGVAPLIERLIQEKQAVGYKYEVGALALERLDRFLGVGQHAKAGEGPADDAHTRVAHCVGREFLAYVTGHQLLGFFRALDHVRQREHAHRGGERGDVVDGQN